MPEIRQKYGFCLCCNRETHLTFHHLVPVKLHGRNYYRKHFTKEQLQEGIDICRKCHDGIHNRFSEKELGKEWNSLAKLFEDAQLRKHFKWVSKQK